MKEKKHFCDQLNNILSQKKFYLCLLILCVLSCTITYNINKILYNAEVASCSESDYTYLKEAASHLYDAQNQSITFNKVPDDIKISNITYDNNEIMVSCILNKDYTYIPNPSITVTISSDFKDIKITQLDNKKATSKVTLTVLSICYGILEILLPLIILLLILLFPYSCSLSKQEQDKHITNNN